MSVLHTLYIVIGLLVFVLNILVVFRNHFPAVLYDALTFGYGMPKTGTTIKRARDPTPNKLPLRVPKRWFTHFYAWGVIWDSCMLAYITSVYLGHVPYVLWWVQPALTYITGHDTEVVIAEQQRRFGTCQFEVVLALVLQTLQVTRRVLECLFVSVFSSKSKMHLSLCLGGYLFYTWNGTTILSQLTTCSDEADTRIQLQWYHFTGVLLFIYASYHQYKCHSILASIRTSRDSNTYGLPKGDWFELVTSPHYFAEILLYTGIAMVQGFKNVWTIAPVILATLVLLLGARLTHEWYTEKYREECSNRRALIPFIY